MKKQRILCMGLTAVCSMFFSHALIVPSVYAASSETVVLAEAAQSFVDMEHGIKLFYPQHFILDTEKDKTNDNVIMRCTNGKLKAELVFTADSFTVPVKTDFVELKSYEEQFLRNQGFDIIKSSVESANNVKCLHVLLKNKNNAVNVIDRYMFYINNYRFNVSYEVAEALHEQLVSDIAKAVELTVFSDPMQRLEIPGTNYSYNMPINKTRIIKKTGNEHVLYTYTDSGDDTGILTGVIVHPLTRARYYKWPKSFANLTNEQKQKFEADYRKELMENPRAIVKNIAFKYKKHNGYDCIVLEYDDQRSHNISYMFLVDGNFVSFDYLYWIKKADDVLPIIEMSAESISLEGRK